jgi:hypothetical protein
MNTIVQQTTVKLKPLHMVLDFVVIIYGAIVNGSIGGIFFSMPLVPLAEEM